MRSSRGTSNLVKYLFLDKRWLLSADITKTSKTSLVCSDSTWTKRKPSTLSGNSMPLTVVEVSPVKQTMQTPSNDASGIKTAANGTPSLEQYKILLDICVNNTAYFQDDATKSGRRLHAGFQVLTEQTIVATPHVTTLLIAAPDFDFDASVQANGYRSYVTVLDASVREIIKVGQKVTKKRDGIFFQKESYADMVERYGALLTSLTVCLRQLIEYLAISTDGNLYLDESHSVNFLKLADNLNTLPFYGKFLGFQYCESMRKILRHISIGLATYDKVYYSKGGNFRKMGTYLGAGVRYTLKTDIRAEKLVGISKFATLEFCKSFWSLPESGLIYQMSKAVGPSIAMMKVIQLQPEPLQCVSRDGQSVEIPLPSSHFLPGPIPVHLLSATTRQGMTSSARAPLSPSLIIHCHGGGFVAQSPRSHEIYLRDWARQLDVPILSIDYSLAPLAPFPRPLEEVLYAYCWALKNCRQLGSTAENVVFAGDSAGANICMALALKCIELNLPPPKGIFVAYFPVLISSAPSPSRILCFMDPILPYGFLLECLRAYACSSLPTTELSSDDEKGILSNGANTNSSDELTSKQLSDGTLAMTDSNQNGIHTVDNSVNEGDERYRNLDVPRDPYLSPWLASDDTLKKFPSISILTVELDPCLDDCVMISKRLKKLGIPTTLDVVPGLTHGFLYFAMLSEEAHAASDLCVSRIKQLLS